MSKQTISWGLVVLILLSLYLFSSIMANFVTVFKTEKVTLSGNVAIIPIKGIITSDEQGGAFSDDGISSTKVLKMIKKAEENKEIKAIIFEINSPGGSAVASEEIATAIKNIEKLNVAWIREVGASGAYWSASATDHIIASRMSATGSIGVISSYLEYAGLLERYNVTYRRLISGKYKDSRSPFKEMNREEQEMQQETLDVVHQYFIDSVAKNRNMTPEQVKPLAEGEVFLGQEALQNGLIDEIGSKDEAIAFIEKELNITAKTVVYEQRKTLADILSGLASRHGYFMGLGEHEGLVIKT